MGLFQKIAGVIGSLFQIGGPTGPNVKNNAGAIEIRNAGDTTFAKLRADASVANVAALPAANTMPDGYVIEVLSQRALYLALPTISGGTWVRMPYCGTWYGTTDVYISPAGTADGAGTAGDPITAAELQKRGFMSRGDGRLDVAVTVHVLYGGGATYGDVVWILPISDGNGGVIIQGEQTLVNASAFTAVTARSKTTNVPLQVTDAAAVWALNDIILLTGAHAGATMSIAKITGTVATTGSAMNIQFAAVAGSVTFTAFGPEITPAANETYAILQLPVFNSLNVTNPEGGVANNTGFSFSMVVQDIHCTTYLDVTNLSSRYWATNRTRAIKGHRFTDVGSAFASVNHIVCPSTGDVRCTSANSASQISFAAGTILDQLYCFTSAWVFLDNGLLFCGANTRARANGPSLIEINDAGFIDGNAAVSARDGGQIKLMAAACVWGVSAVAGSVTYALEAFGSVRKTASTWALASPHKGALGTAGTTDATVGGQQTMNSFDRASGTGAYVGLVAMTMAKLDAAVGVAGFGGHAWSPEFGAGFAAT